jgi:hypothetical protein
VDPPYRLVAPPLAAQPLEQIPEFVVQVLTILRFGHAIHPDRGVIALASIRPAQRFHIDQVSQRVKLSLRLCPRSFRYLQEFR